MNGETSPGEQRYTADHLIFWPAGHGRMRAHSRFLPGRLVAVSEGDAKLLSACGGLKTLAEHAESAAATPAAAERQWLGRVLGSRLTALAAKARIAATQALLAEAACAGHLLSEGALKDLLRRSRTRSAPARIHTIRITTLNQPQALRRCIQSYAANASRWGRQVRFVVLDDDRTDPPLDARAQPIRQSAEAHQVAYIGFRRALAYCERLARLAEVDRQVVRFALLPDERLRRTDGASKNALMLDGCSERYLQVDDDTECHLGRIEPRAGVRFSFGPRPLDAWYFATRQEAVDAVSSTDSDFAAAHDAVLGHAVSVIASRTETGLAFEGPLKPLFACLLAADAPAVRVTFCGLAGDAASDSPFRCVSEEGRSRERLVHDESRYGALKLTREVVRVAPITTMTRPLSGMAFAMGCDATDLLPPFFPLGRSYELAFNLLLAKCDPAALVAHLPIAVIHSPLERRAYEADSLWRDVTRVRLPDLAAMLIARIPVAPHLAGAPVLVHCGETLRQWARLPWPELNELVVSTILAERVNHLNRLHELLRRHRGQPKWWAEDVRRQIEELERGLSIEVCPQFSDYPQFGGQSPEARRGLQEMIRLFGEVLHSWPAMYEAARVLKDREDGLSDRLLTGTVATCDG